MKNEQTMKSPRLVRTPPVKARLWPNGEFCIWSPRQTSGFDPEQDFPLDLSKVSNSHKLTREVPKAARGSRGLTRYGARMVRSCAWLLQRKHGGRRLTFLTLTLPGPPPLTLKAARSWGRIVRVFQQALKRELKKYSLGPEVVGVTEIQPKRFLRTGGMPLHLHMVFQGAHRDHIWCIRPERFRQMWRSAVTAAVPEYSSLDFGGSADVGFVRKSAESYLGKYISKGFAGLADIKEKHSHLMEYFPSSWYNMTCEAREGVLKHVVEGEDVAYGLEVMQHRSAAGECMFGYFARRTVKGADGAVLASFIVGTIRPEYRRSLGLRVHPAEIFEL